MPSQTSQHVSDDHASPKDSRQDEGWTRVTAKSRAGRRNKVAKARELPIKVRTDGLSPASELLADYHRMRPQWELQTCCRRMRELLAKNAGGLKTVSRAINLGNGTFDPHQAAWDGKRCSFVQLIAFTIMVEDLENITGSKIKTVFQDPAFTTSDKEFLASLGHRVVEAPAAMALVDEDAFVFGIHLYREVYAEALEKSLPAILIGTGYSVWEEILDTDKLDRVEEVDRTYRRNPFPQETHGGALYGTFMYWRPGIETQAESSGVVVKEDTKEKPEETEDLSKKLEATSLGD
ncbi:hypothetical protein B0T10DRAFT_493595 [Thelonectria olida]|uniref:SRR1-like domain-containing protein n=1 Tax=Thelonectria olida TaxID=1576542 RepID=A0A9P9AM03_9HYPO|nr:hypothetical protein B0T10DRAFT_493595 [Thelonectria olida]